MTGNGTTDILALLTVWMVFTEFGKPAAKLDVLKDRSQRVVVANG